MYPVDPVANLEEIQSTEDILNYVTGMQSIQSTVQTAGNATGQISQLNYKAGGGGGMKRKDID
jgi:hypothetical protein